MKQNTAIQRKTMRSTYEPNYGESILLPGTGF